MQIDFYALRGDLGRLAPDLEHELVREDALARARAGQVVLIKVWFRTDGVAQLDQLEAALRAALAPLGVR